MSRKATRPGPWIQAWHDLWASFSRVPKKRYVGEDSAGNSFYEYLAGEKRKGVQRGFDAPPKVENPPPPSLEWQAWLNMSRKYPPSEEEIRLNMLKQQAQLTQDAETEKRAPKIDSKGIGAADMDKKQKWSSDFPKYDDEAFEMNPGAKKQSQLEKEERERQTR